jgi:hypothetical protein
MIKQLWVGLQISQMAKLIRKVPDRRKGRLIRRSKRQGKG